MSSNQSSWLGLDKGEEILFNSYTLIITVVPTSTPTSFELL